MHLYGLSLLGQCYQCALSNACFCSGTFFSCLLVCAAGLWSSDYCLGRPLCLGLYFFLALLRLSLFCSRLASLASAIMLSRIFCHLVVFFFIRRVDMTIAIGTLGLTAFICSVGLFSNCFILSLYEYLLFGL